MTRGAVWQRPIAAVLNAATKRPEGTAFLVMPDIALTCAHVVEDATRGGAADKVALRFHFLGDAGIDVDAEVVADRARTGGDIAVLQLTEPAKLSASESYRLRPPDLATGPVSFRSWGYPKGYDSGDEAHARITGPTPTGLRAVHEPDHPRFLEKGFSGAPAASLTHEETALAMGMAVTVDSKGQPIGELLPCELLLAALRLCTEPYRLLRPFDVSDRHLFFGREKLVETLLDDPVRGRFVVLTGPSGSGKSSVLRAGLIPRRTEQGWKVVLIGATEPFEQLAKRLNCGADADSILRSLGETARDPGKQGVLLAIDQAEEMFPTVTPGLEPPALPLARLLAHAREELEERLSVGLAIRSDFLDRLLALAPLRRSVERGIAFVDPLDEAALTDAIERPAGLLGVRFDADLVRRIVRDVQTGAATLPMLQVALHRMWRALDGGVMRTAAYDTLKGHAANGVLGAMAAHASEAVAGLPSDILEAVLLELVEPGARRRRPFLLDRFTPEERKVVARLEEQQLIERRMDSRGVMVTLAHDSLITAWPLLADLLVRTREFRVWLEDMKTRVRTWQRQPDQVLWGSALQVARGMADQHKPLLRHEPEILQLIDKSVHSAEQEARTEKERQERLLRESEERAAVERRLREDAEARTREAQLQESRAIATLARQASLRSDHMTAMLAALEVLPDPDASPPRNRPAGSTAAMALLHAWWNNREWCALFGHKHPVRHAAFSPNGRFVVTASDDGTARVWGLTGDLTQPRVLQGHTDRVLHTAFSPDGQRVVTASDDCTARVWDLEGDLGQPHLLQGHGRWVRHAAFSPDGRFVVTASDDGTARVWDLEGDLASPRLLQGHGGRVNHAAFSPEGQRVVTASDDCTARVWDLEGDLTQPRVLQGHGGAVSHAAFSPDGQRVVTASFDKTARVWDLDGDLASPPVLRGHDAWVNHAAFSPDGRFVVTASEDRTARVWDLAGDQTQPRLLQGHGYQVNHAAFSPDGRFVVTASDDNTARVWDLAGDLGQPRVLQGHIFTVPHAAFSPDGQRVVTAGSDNTARVWDLAADLTRPRVLQGQRAPIQHAAFSPDGRFVVTVDSDDRTARVWDLAGDMATPRALQGHTDQVRQAAFCPDGQRLITASDDRTARVWDLAGDLARPRLLRGHTDVVRHAAFSPDGQRVVTASWDKTARVWVLDGDLTRPRLLQGHARVVRYAAFSPDGQRVVTASDDRTALVWDIDGDLASPRVLQGHGGRVNHAAFSPDGRFVVTASDDFTALVWDLDGDLTQPRLLQGHGGWVRHAAFSPDGQRVVTASDDRTARVWDLGGELGRPRVLQGHADRVTDAAFSPDGQRVVTASRDNTARVWDLGGGRPEWAAPPVDGGVRAMLLAPDGQRLLTLSDGFVVQTWPLPEIAQLIGHAKAALTRGLTVAQRDEFGLAVPPDAPADRNAVPPPPR